MPTNSLSRYSSYSYYCYSSVSWNCSVVWAEHKITLLGSELSISIHPNTIDTVFEITDFSL